MFPQLKLHLRCPLIATQAISLSSQATQKCLCNLCVEGISPAAFCQPPLSGISVVGTYTECTKSQRKSTLVMNVLVLFVPCEEEERMRTCEDLVGAD